MSVFNLIELAALPIIGAAILVEWRPLAHWDAAEDSRVVLKVILTALYVMTVGGLGCGAIIGVLGAWAFLPNEDADAPIQFMGAIYLAYAVVAALVLTATLLVTTRDFRCAFGRK